MSLPHVILTVLSQRCATGYDITKEFSNSIGNFWKASHQQVYRELNKLAEMGAVTCRLEPQDGKPDRKIYSITELGRETLQEWYLLPAKHATDRDEVSAKLLISGIYEKKHMAEHMQSLIDESRIRLCQFQEQEKHFYADLEALPTDMRLERLILRRNILLKKAWLTWADEVQQELQA